MPTDAVIATTVNFTELQQAFADAPVETARWVKTPLFRFARRVRRRAIQQMTGRKGEGPLAKGAGEALFGGQFKRGNHVQGIQVGNSLGGMRSVNRVSRILRTHIEGVTITPKSGGFLFLGRKSGKAGTGAVFARVKSVTIPARVKFEEPWRQEIPKATEQIGDAMHRAMGAALDRRMKAIGSAVSRVTSL
jgi:hypothetical protein